MTTARVSRHMKRAAVVVALAGIVGAIWYLQRPHGSKASAADPPPPAAQPPPQPQRPRRITKVTKLSNAEQRKLLADAIAAAHAARTTPAKTADGRAAISARPAPSLPPEAIEKDMSDPETLKVEIRAAMKEVVPMLKECYEAEMDQLPDETKVVAELTLTGDPDIGTLIDAHKILDDKQQPLSAKFDDCLRSNLQLMALPPLAEGDRVEVHYPFVFGKR